MVGVAVGVEILRDVRELPRYAREGVLADMTLPGAFISARSERPSAETPEELHSGAIGSEQLDGAAIKGLDALWVEAVASRCDFL
jgi:hypothetical protein